MTMSPEFIQMMRKNRWLLGQIHKNSKNNPYDFYYGLEYLVQFMRFMRDYYKLGENVHSQSLFRLETLEKTLNYYDKWQGLEDEYIQVVKTGEFKSHDNGDGTFTIDNIGYKCIYKYGSMKRTYRKLKQKQRKYKKLFFKMLYKNIESWWD